MPRMRRILETLAVAIACVGAFLLVKEFKTSLFSSASMQEASDTASATAEKQIKLAQDKATENKSATEILAKKSRKDITATLDATQTDKAKFVAASNFFFGTYFLNTRAHAEYCASRGIKIDSFVAAYSNYSPPADHGGTRIGRPARASRRAWRAERPCSRPVAMTDKASA